MVPALPVALLASDPLSPPGAVFTLAACRYFDIRGPEDVGPTVRRLFGTSKQSLEENLKPLQGSMKVSPEMANNALAQRVRAAML